MNMTFDESFTRIRKMLTQASMHFDFEEKHDAGRLVVLRVHIHLVKPEEASRFASMLVDREMAELLTKTERKG